MIRNAIIEFRATAGLSHAHLEAAARLPHADSEALAQKSGFLERAARAYVERFGTDGPPPEPKRLPDAERAAFERWLTDVWVESYVKRDWPRTIWVGTRDSGLLPRTVSIVFAEGSHVRARGSRALLSLRLSYVSKPYTLVEWFPGVSDGRATGGSLLLAQGDRSAELREGKRVPTFMLEGELLKPGTLEICSYKPFDAKPFDAKPFDAPEGER